MSLKLHIIDYQMRTIRDNRSMFTDVEFDIDPLNLLFNKIESQVSSTAPVSLADALRFAIELENDALGYHYRTLITKSNPEVGELIKKLGSADKEHFDKLNILAQNRVHLD